MITNSATGSALGPARIGSQGRARLSNLYGVVVLLTLIFDRRDADAVLELAANAVPSLGYYRTEVAYRVVTGSLTDRSDPDRRLDNTIDSMVAANLGVDQEILLPDGDWGYAITLRAIRGSGACWSFAATGASPDDLLLLKAVAHQAAAMMTHADLIKQERAQRRQLNDLTQERAQTIRRLYCTVAELKCSGMPGKTSC